MSSKKNKKRGGNNQTIADPEHDLEGTIAVEEFLDTFIDGYLIADIETMLRPDAKPAGEQPGHLGYPLFMTVATGIEVLGALRFSTHTRFEDGDTTFARYWKEYLYPAESRRGDVGRGVYQLARNGIAHAYAAKSVTITTGNRGQHLCLVDGVATIDATTLAGDFKRSLARYRLDLPNQRQTVNANFTRLRIFNAGQIEGRGSVFDCLPKLSNQPAATGPSNQQLGDQSGLTVAGTSSLGTFATSNGWRPGG